MPTRAPDRPVVVGTAFRYSVVRSIEHTQDRCSLTTESPTRAQSRLQIHCPLDREFADHLRSAGLRPLAVKLDLGASDVPECTALFTSAQGPERRPIPLGAALALCAAGFHTVVTRRR